MSKKLVAAGIAAALSLSLSPVASAQSSFPALSSSSSTSNVSKVQQLEDDFAKALEDQGHTRHTQHDEAAEKAVQSAIDGNVVFVASQGANFPGLEEGQNISDGYMNVYLRFPLEHIDTVLQNIDDATGVTPAPGVSIPFGLAVDEAESKVYIAFVIPLSAAF